MSVKRLCMKKIFLALLFLIVFLIFANAQAFARVELPKCFPPKVTSLVWHSEADIAFYGKLKIEDQSELIKNFKTNKQATFLVKEVLKGLPLNTKELNMSFTSVRTFTSVKYQINNNRLIGGKYKNGVLYFEPVVRNSCASEQEILSYMRLPYPAQVFLILADYELIKEILFDGFLFLWLAGVLLLFLIVKVIQRKRNNGRAG